MILLGISGGPDSMYLLYKYRNRNIVVAHINYNLRPTSNYDETIVRTFCAKHKIRCEVLTVKTKPHGNLQAWARKIRYDFFKKVAGQYNIKKLFIAHHKDDFVETALMQQRSGRMPKYFGIKQKKQLYGLKIKRPFLHKIWKREIERFLHKKNLDYAVDDSNAKNIYTRNKIRNELNKVPFSEKRNYYEWFKMSNKILVKKHKKVDALFKKWSKTKFDTRFFSSQRFKHQLVFEFIHQNFKNVKLSKGKIEGLIAFIDSQENNKLFKLNDNAVIWKKQYHLLV